MEFLVEILLLGILVGGSYAGIKLGFINIAAKPLKVVAALIFAYSFCSFLGKGIIAPIISAPITEYVKDFMYDNCRNLSPDNVISEIPTLLKMAGAVSGYGVASFEGRTTDEIIEAVVLAYTKPFSEIVSVIFAFIILLFVGQLLIKLVIQLINGFCSGGILAFINKSSGFVLAGFLSVLAAWALVSMMEFFFHLPVFSASRAVNDFEGGFLYKILNSFNPLELLLSF